MRRALNSTSTIVVSILSFLLLMSALDAEPTALQSAIQPLGDGVPDVAVTRLREILNTALPEAERRKASEELAEALVAANQPSEALRVLEDSALRDLPEARFFRAQALAGLGRWNEALPIYHEVANDSASSFQSDATFGEAEALRALKRSKEARAKFGLLDRDERWGARARLRETELLLDEHDVAGAGRMLTSGQTKSASEKKARRFLRGRLEVERHHPEKAIEIFQAILKNPEDASHDVIIATLCAIADAHLQLKIPESGDDFLETFIEQRPTDPKLSIVFAKLDELYRAERKPSRNELARWSRDPSQPRQALAHWYLARAFLRSGRRDDAIADFAKVRESRVQWRVLAPALFEYAQLEMEGARLNEAMAILRDAAALHPNADVAEKIDMLAATARYRAKKYEEAAEMFDRLAHSSTSSVAQSAIINASLTWLQVGNHTRFQEKYQQLSEHGADAASRADLLLEEGLVQAAQGDRKAIPSLQEFLRNFPNGKRASEAWVALAELAFHASPPHFDEARNDLARAAASLPTPQAAERADYLMIWIEDAAPNVEDTKVVALANQFLQKHPASPFAPDVRMKLAESYFRRQDFSNAQTQFEILAEKDPNTPLSEKALFFAAESAVSSMGAHSLDRAIVLLDEIAHKNGELKWSARNEQAAIERKLGKPQDALLLYEEVLKSDAKSAEKREALCGRGDIYFEMGATDPKNYDRAIEIYDQLAAEKDASAHWRNQALFKKGVCLEKKSDRPAALATFYKIIEEQSRPDRAREFFWFYKAGFNAARILEDDSKWQPAATIYEKLASAGGTRSEEANARLARLRLEHFLWDQ
jgi:TolA-binding protein